MTNKRKIIIKTVDGAFYETESMEDITAESMAYALMYAPMMVAKNKHTSDKEIVLLRHVVSYTFEDGLNEDDISSLTDRDESGDNTSRKKEKSDRLNFSDFIKDGKGEVH